MLQVSISLSVLIRLGRDTEESTELDEGDKLGVSNKANNNADGSKEKDGQVEDDVSQKFEDGTDGNAKRTFQLQSHNKNRKILTWSGNNQRGRWRRGASSKRL
jgi:hypothetical protein